MFVIPLQPIPNQTVSVILGAQACSIKVYQRTTGLYVDLYVNNVLIIGGVLGLNLVKIVRDAYLGFVGDLCFCDVQAPTLADGSVDFSSPDFTGLGSRYLFLYLEVTDL